MTPSAQMQAIRREMSRLPWPGLATRLAMLCALLGVVAAAEIASGARPQPVAQAAGNADPAPPVQDEAKQDFALPPLSSFSEITQRPLFSDTRRPALAADQSGEAWSSFVLKGVIVSPMTRQALLLHSAPAALVSLQEGEMLDGWTAETILPDRVVFRKGDAERDLKLAAARESEEPDDHMPAVPTPLPLARPAPPSF